MQFTEVATVYFLYSPRVIQAYLLDGQNKSETKLNASALKSDPNTQKVKKTDHINGTTRNMRTSSGQIKPLFQTNGLTGKRWHTENEN